MRVNTCSLSARFGLRVCPRPHIEHDLNVTHYTLMACSHIKTSNININP